MFRSRNKQKTIERATEYASCKDFQQIFNEDMVGLHRLAFLLTADMPEPNNALWPVWKIASTATLFSGNGRARGASGPLFRVLSKPLRPCQHVMARSRKRQKRSGVGMTLRVLPLL